VALTSLPAAEERGRSSPGIGLWRRTGDFVARATREGFFAARERQGSVDLGEMMVTVGAWEWGEARGGQGPHVATRQLTRRRRRRLTRCNSCVDDEWVHEHGRIEHNPYFIRRSTGFSEI
jgi:hypothetical protein